MLRGDWCLDLSRKCLLDEGTGPLIGFLSLVVAFITLIIGVGVAVLVYRRQKRLTEQIADMQMRLAWESRRDEVIAQLRTEPDERVARRRLIQAELYVEKINPKRTIFSDDLTDLHRAYWSNPSVRLPDKDSWPEHYDAVQDLATTLRQRFPSNVSCFDVLPQVKPFLARLASDTQPSLGGDRGVQGSPSVQSHAPASAVA
jgi:hypothetical protein